MADQHIVALGGGGFSDEPDGSLLDDYILSLVAAPTPRVCFVGTASGDADSYLLKFYQAFGVRRCKPSHLGLFRRDIDDVREHLLAQDVVYVGGGNTVNMLAIWRAHGVDEILRECWARGVVLCGVSAGSMCWFEASITDSFGAGLAPVEDGLGILKGSNCPHFDGEELRRPRYHDAVAAGLLAGLAVDDHVALHFVGTDLHAVVSERPNASAYRVAADGGSVVETAIDTRYLGCAP